MTLRAALTTLLLASGLAHAQPIPGTDPGPAGRAMPAGPATQAPAPAPPAPPTAPNDPAPVPPPEAVAPPSDPDTLPAGALPLAIAPGEPVEVAARPYPRALAERPLTIPAGMIEAGLTFVVARGEIVDKPLTSMGIAPDVTYALGKFGLSAGAAVILDVSPDNVMVAQGYNWQFQDEDRLSTVYAAARFAPVPDLSLGLQLVGNGITTEVPRTTMRVVGSYKAHVAPKLAITASVAPGFSRVTYQDTQMFVDESRTAFVLTGGLAATAQVAPLVAVVARAALDLSYEGAADPNAFVLFGDPGLTIVQSYGAHLVGSVTPMIDLVGGADMFVYEAPTPTVYQFTLGFVVRNPQ